ncbi:hypothetical protein QUR06_000268 [Escherichia coli]|nr:hypothetical protein [Escherichia coli]
MIFKKEFKEVGSPTNCTDLDFVQAIQEREPIHQHCTDQEMKDRYTQYFEMLERYEYSVRDNDGKLLAIMVVSADFDLHLGQLCLVPTMAYSLKAGLLYGAYKWFYSLPRETGIKWIRTSKTKGYEIITKYKEMSIDGATF